MIRYPKGMGPSVQTKKPKKIKGLQENSYKNRGMSLENEINLTNDYYLTRQRALIYKRPTPINVVKVDYAKGAVITKAYFEKQSTTDYNGVYRGRYIDFEAKSTLNKKSLPVANISSHQLIHLQEVIRHGGIAFFMINFQIHDEVWFVKAESILEAINERKVKSLSYQWIESHGYKIPISLQPRLDYLPIIDQLFF
jgi:recombination protein U